MATIDDVQKQLDEFVKQAEKFSVDKQINLLNTLQNKLGIVAGIAQESFSKIRSAVDVIADAGDDIKEMGNQVAYAETEMDQFLNVATNVVGLFSRFDGFERFSQGLDNFNSIKTNFEELEKKFGNFENALKAIGKSAPELAQKLAGMGRDAALSYLNQADQAAKLDAGIIKLAASTGNLFNLYNNTDNLQNLSDVSALYAKNLNDVAGATGLNIKQITDYTNALGNLPGLIGTTTNAGEENEKQMQKLEVVTKLAASAGIGASEAANILKSSYENLGNAQGKLSDENQKGIELFAAAIESANKLGVRFSDTENFLLKTADTFKFMGDNTAAATRTLATFTDALRETGLTGKQSMEVVQGMIQSTKELTTGTKAFLSLRSGGPGGLQGAFRIDRLIREGKTDEVIQMMIKSLRQQIGGRIVSQDEADRSPQLAAQFFRQRELLKSGAFGGLAKDDATATKLLDALSRGNLTAAKTAISTGESAVKNAVDKGTDIQRLQYNSLKSINTAVDLIASKVGINANQQLKESLGTGKFGSETAQELNKLADQRSQAAAEFKFLESKAPPKENTNRNIDRQAAQLFVSGTGMTGKGIADLTKELGSFGDEALNIIRNKQDKNRSEDVEKAIQAGQTKSENITVNPPTINNRINPNVVLSKLPTTQLNDNTTASIVSAIKELDSNRTPGNQVKQFLDNQKPENNKTNQEPITLNINIQSESGYTAEVAPDYNKQATQSVNLVVNRK
jgi:hypothetical protein